MHFWRLDDALECCRAFDGVSGSISHRGAGFHGRSRLLCHPHATHGEIAAVPGSFDRGSLSGVLRQLFTRSATLAAAVHALP